MGLEIRHRFHPVNSAMHPQQIQISDACYFEHLRHQSFRFAISGFLINYLGIDPGTKHRHIKAKNAAIPLHIELHNFKEPSTISHLQNSILLGIEIAVSSLNTLDLK